MNPFAFFKSLPTAEQDAFAAKAGTTADYLRQHIFTDNPKRVGSLPFIMRLEDACDGAFTVGEYFDGRAAIIRATRKAA